MSSHRRILGTLDDANSGNSIDSRIAREAGTTIFCLPPPMPCVDQSDIQDLESTEASADSAWKFHTKSISRLS
jgi:hypothetical protein